MLDISEQKRRVPNPQMALAQFKSSLSIIALQQAMTQYCWFNHHPLSQLPHITESDVKAAIKKNRGDLSVRQFKSLPEEKKKSLFQLDEKQWEEVEDAADHFPSVDCEVKAYVEDEDEICCGDILSIKVDLFRLTSDEVLNGRTRKSPEEEKKDETPDEEKTLEQLIEELPQQKKKAPKRIDAYAYAPNFPFPKVEQWYVYLMRGEKPFTLLQPIITFTDFATITIRIPTPPTPQTLPFTVCITCDSYRGVDVKQTFRVDVKPKPEPTDYEKEEEEDLDEEEEYSPFWDYVVGFFMLCGLYLWMDSKGYWQEYVTPFTNKFFKLIAPLTDQLVPYVAPVYNMIFGGDDAEAIKEEL
jgi:hypothetical protein